MFAANKPHNKPKSTARDPRQVYPIALRRAAKMLGYTPAHIARVVRGERISPPTLRAYRDLCRREGVRFELPAA